MALRIICSLLAVCAACIMGVTAVKHQRLVRTHGKGITTRTWLTVQRIVTKLDRVGASE